jgi:hypothetical protein
MKIPHPTIDLQIISVFITIQTEKISRRSAPLEQSKHRWKRMRLVWAEADMLAESLLVKM